MKLKKTRFFIIFSLLFLSLPAHATSLDEIYRDLVRSDNSGYLPMFVKNRNAPDFLLDDEAAKQIMPPKETKTIDMKAVNLESERPNKGWDAVLPRICTWGKFRDKQTGFTFLFFNLHMDHIGVQARAESAKLILKKLKEFPEKLPAILTGDCNVDQHNESYLLLDNSGIMRDSYQIADFRYVPNGTFNAFHADRKTDSRIDHLFLTKEFDVKKYGVLTDTYRSEAKDAKNEQNANFPKEVSMQKHVARVPSDHFPVMIVVEVK